MITMLDRVLAMAHLTWLEARRRRIVLAALLCGLAFVLVFGVVLYFFMRSQNANPEVLAASVIRRQIGFQVMAIAGFTAVNFLVVAISVVLPVDALSGDISSGIMQTVASKPVRRAEIVVGKWLVYWLMLGGYVVLVAGGIALMMWIMTGFKQAHLLPLLGLMHLEATVLLTVTIAAGSRLSTVTNGIFAFGFYALAFIGGWIEQAGVFLNNGSARYAGTAISLLSPADAIWRLALYVIQPPIMAQVQISPFSTASVPSAAMVWWAAGFVVAVLLIGIRGFQQRAL